MTHWGVFILSLLCLSEAQANSIMFRAIGVNQEVLFEQPVEVGQQNLGDLTDQVLSTALALHVLSDYQGTPEGVLSINHLGNGLEVITQNDVNAYGWCYQIDGNAVNLLANQYQFSGQESVVEWFYGYDNLNGSNWSTTCSPADHVPPAPVQNQD